MADRPITYYPWAMNDEVDTFVDPEGTTHSDVPNKQEPFGEFKDFGIFFRGLPIQFLNYQWNGWSLWYSYIDQRKMPGDVIEVDDSLVAGDVNVSKGGTWTEIGTKGTGPTARKLFIKTT
jgi:hypothetical protein